MKYFKLFEKKYGEYIRDLTAFANPIFLILISLFFLGPSTIFITILVGLAINEAVGSIIKFLFPKKRPNNQKYSNSLEKIDAGSFPSIHSSRVMFVYLMLFTSTPFAYLKVIFLSIILVVGYSRLFLKKHYLIDVLGGYILGLVLYLTLI